MMKKNSLSASWVCLNVMIKILGPVHHFGVEIKEKFRAILTLKISELKDIGNIQFNPIKNEKYP